MKLAIYCFCVWFGMNILFAAWLTLRSYFKGEADRLNNVPTGSGRPGDSPRYGLRDKLMSRILERRLDE